MCQRIHQRIHQRAQNSRYPGDSCRTSQRGRALRLVAQDLPPGSIAGPTNRPSIGDTTRGGVARHLVATGGAGRDTVRGSCLSQRTPYAPCRDAVGHPPMLTIFNQSTAQTIRCSGSQLTTRASAIVVTPGRRYRMAAGEKEKKGGRLWLRFRLTTMLTASIEEFSCNVQTVKP